MSYPSDKPVRILLFIDDWTSYRDYIRGEVLHVLLEDPSVEIILASKFHIARLPKELQIERVRLYHVSSPKPTLFSRVIYGIAKTLFMAEHPDGTLVIKLKSDAYTRGRKVRMRLFLGGVLSALGFRSDRIARLQQRSVRRNDFAAVLDAEKPSCVLYTCVIPFKAECLKDAKKRHIPLILAFSFWDQATSKGPLAVVPDYVLSWSEEMSQEIRDHHFLPTEKIQAQGVLYFDAYFNCQDVLSREAFYKQYGIPLDRKIILYGMGDSRTLKCNLDFLNVMRSMIVRGELGAPCHLMVRVSPKDDYTLYQHLKNDEHVTVVYPKGSHEPMLNRWLPDADEDSSRVNQLKHCAVVACVSSTLILDSLCMDKPVVNLGYDGGEERPYEDSVKRFFDYTHAKPVLDEGGTWIVRNDTELCEALRTYIAAPETHKEQRQNLLQRIINYTDGRSHQRWADAILGIAKKRG
jgi:hypothetical protein